MNDNKTLEDNSTGNLSVYFANRDLGPSKQMNTCYFCGYQFGVRSKLYRHLNTHTGEKPYFCTFEGCDKAFSTNSTLKVHHHYIHQTGEKTVYKCKYCTKEYASSSNLRRHIRDEKHLENIKPRLHCLTCNKTFKTNQNLKQHTKTHSSRRIFKCTGCVKKCGKIFKTKKDLMRHQQNVQYNCVVCCDYTSRKDNVHRHLRKVHKIESKDERNISITLANPVNFSNGYAGVLQSATTTNMILRSQEDEISDEGYNGGDISTDSNNDSSTELSKSSNTYGGVGNSSGTREYDVTLQYNTVEKETNIIFDLDLNEVMNAEDGPEEELLTISLQSEWDFILTSARWSPLDDMVNYDMQ